MVSLVQRQVELIRGNVKMLDSMAADSSKKKIAAPKITIFDYIPNVI